MRVADADVRQWYADESQQDRAHCDAPAAAADEADI